MAPIPGRRGKEDGKRNQKRLVWEVMNSREEMPSNRDHLDEEMNVTDQWFHGDCIQRCRYGLDLDLQTTIEKSRKKQAQFSHQKKNFRRCAVVSLLKKRSCKRSSNAGSIVEQKQGLKIYRSSPWSSYKDSTLRSISKPWVSLQREIFYHQIRELCRTLSKVSRWVELAIAEERIWVARFVKKKRVDKKPREWAVEKE